MTLAVRASAPPLVAFAFVTERPSGSPSILTIVWAPVFPSAPGVTAITSASARPLPIIVTAFWVVYFVPAAVFTIHPFGTVSTQIGNGEHVCVNVTVPLEAVAGIGFWPVGVPGRFCDSSA